MATEARRGCGYRKVGGIYLVAGGAGVPCDRLPFPLTVCPTCSCGFKQTRGWTWVNLEALTGEQHNRGGDNPCIDEGPCPVCDGGVTKAGLLWVGEGFYKTPEAFNRESNALGISRRIKSVPKDFTLGETWVLLAHPKAVPPPLLTPLKEFLEETDDEPKKPTPGIFRAFKPERIEILVTESQKADNEFMAKVEKRGLTPVVVPDDDKDHQGSVYDKAEEEPEPPLVDPPSVNAGPEFEQRAEPPAGS